MRPIWEAWFKGIAIIIIIVLLFGTPAIPPLIHLRICLFRITVMSNNNNQVIIFNFIISADT